MNGILRTRQVNISGWGLEEYRSGRSVAGSTILIGLLRLTSQCFFELALGSLEHQPLCLRPALDLAKKRVLDQPVSTSFLIFLGIFLLLTGLLYLLTVQPQIFELWLGRGS